MNNNTQPDKKTQQPALSSLTVDAKHVFHSVILDSPKEHRGPQQFQANIHGPTHGQVCAMLSNSAEGSSVQGTLSFNHPQVLEDAQ